MVCCSGPYFYEREERNRGGAPPGLWPHEVGKLKRQVGGRSRICVTTSLAYGLRAGVGHSLRSEEHTSELQSPCNLVCRLLLETTYMPASSNTLIVIIGDGTDRERLQSRVRSLGLEQRVVFLGRQRPDAMPGFFAAADALLVHL